MRQVDLKAAAEALRPGGLANGADNVEVVTVKIAEDWDSTAASGSR